jgi:signal transduction histidine kinase
LDAKTKKVRIEVIPGGKRLDLDADHDRICLALEHILLNSVRATDPDGIIDLEVLTNKDSVSIIVEDSGFGMDPSQIEFMFEAFNRIARPDDNGGELGLGLAIVRAIAERHGGSAEIESSPMSGTRFTLTLPR